MNPQDWAAIATIFSILLAGLAWGIRWTVQHYLSELKPNSGSSMNDRLVRVEAMLELLLKER